MNLRDIESKDDLRLIFEAFYKKAIQHEVIGHFFTAVVPIDLKTHLPIIVDFWEYNLFHKGSYNKNLLAIHQHIDDKFPITYEDIDIWVSLLHQTVDELFEGTQSGRLKTNALSIATVMKLKIAKDC